MKAKLFIDDERFPPDDGEEWFIARSYEVAIEYCLKYGCPSFISWDHDLGQNAPTGGDFAYWLIETDINFAGEFVPKDFAYYVHSQNPIGVQHIKGLLDPYLGQK